MPLLLHGPMSEARPTTEQGLRRRPFEGSQLPFYFLQLTSAITQGTSEELGVCCSTTPGRTNLSSTKFLMSPLLQMSLLVLLLSAASILSCLQRCRTNQALGVLFLLLLNISQFSNAAFPSPSGKYLHFQQPWCLLLSFRESQWQ